MSAEDWPTRETRRAAAERIMARLPQTEPDNASPLYRSMLRKVQAHDLTEQERCELLGIAYIESPAPPKWVEPGDPEGRTD